MRFHVVSLPHTETTSEYEWCAYTAKARKFSNMMMARGHEVFLYAGPRNEANCTEHIPCTNLLPENGFIPEFDPNDELSFKPFNSTAIVNIWQRIEPRDFVCLIGGQAQAPIADAFQNNQVVEYGIGYGGVLPDTYHVYESYAWMQTVYGAQTMGVPTLADGRFYDAVIPNYFDVNDFPEGEGDGECLLFMGRVIERKGIRIALDLAERSGMHLIVAGAGDYPLPDWVDYRGVVGPEERAALMGGATALIAPTLYLEPFGGVAVEAQLCGTPAITTDWGAFPETVLPKYRCRTLAEFEKALDCAKVEDRKFIRSRARGNWSLEVVAPQYERYFERLQGLWSKGFYD